MKWNRLGLVCKPNNRWWSASHCYVPTPEVLEKLGVIRVYFASWDKNWRGRIGYANFDINSPSKLVYQSISPILDVGEPGLFDSDGIFPSQAIHDGDYHFLYYGGFQRTIFNKIVLVFAGIAVETKSGRFIKLRKIPILDRKKDEEFLRSSLYIIKEDDVTKCWYTASETGWVNQGKNTIHSWTKYPFYGISLIDTKNSYISNYDQPIRCTGLKRGHIAIGRPWVVKEDNVYKMWYSGRSLSIAYEILYAESEDGVNWEIKDCGLQKYGDGPESDMVCFGAVVDIRGTRYMYYNGNSHGKDGILLAVWD